MKPIYFLPFLSLLIFAPTSANAAGSMLRVTCEGDDIGAEVQINGKFKGECPVDISIAEGAYKLHVEKKDASYERVFEQDIRMGDGIVKKIEAVLSKRLNAEGQRREDQRMAVERAERAEFEASGLAMVQIPGRNYEMGKYDVTQKGWREVMGNNPSYFTNCGDTCPVERVSWDDAQAFIQKLNAKTGKQYRLPTEAEWEYACYGGSKTEYCGGNDLNAVAWYKDNSNNQTHPAGQKQANGYGLYDMSGNVWEWMQDKYDNEHDVRVLRGGSWNREAGYASAVYRGWYGPTTERSYVYGGGFRLARTLP